MLPRPKGPPQAGDRDTGGKSPPAAYPAAPVADPLLSILESRFGFPSLRPLQEEIVQQVMGGGNALVVMPTGSGKSLCYQLPALAMEGPGVTLVFSPLIAWVRAQVCPRGLRRELGRETPEGLAADRLRLAIPRSGAAVAKCCVRRV